MPRRAGSKTRHLRFAKEEDSVNMIRHYDERIERYVDVVRREPEPAVIHNIPEPASYHSVIRDTTDQRQTAPRADRHEIGAGLCVVVAPETKELATRTTYRLHDRDRTHSWTQLEVRSVIRCRVAPRQVANLPLRQCQYAFVDTARSPICHSLSGAPRQVANLPLRQCQFWRTVWVALRSAPGEISVFTTEDAREQASLLFLFDVLRWRRSERLEVSHK